MVMDDLMRSQYSNALTAYARRQQGGLPPATLGAPATVPYALHPPGQQAPAEHYNFQPVGNGAWRIYPPGVQAPSHGPQGSHPELPTDYADFQRLGNDIHRTLRSGGAPGAFSVASPQPGPQRPQRPPGGIAGII